MDKLYFSNGPLAGGTAELIGEEITIGRLQENAICIDDESVGERHAVIVRKNRECIVRDLGSGLGTRIRGEKVIVATLQNGDRVAFGSVEAQFETSEIKLTLPVSSAASAELPPTVGTPTWPQRRLAQANPKGSPFKTAVFRLVQVVAVAALAVGGYWAYQELRSVSDAPPTGSPVAARLTTPASAPAQPSPTTAAVPPRQPAPEPSPVTPATVPAQAAPVVAPARIALAGSHPALQQARLLVAQNKHLDAIVYLDKLIASATDPMVITEAQVPLKQALDGQLAWLQTTKQQWEAQCKGLEERLKAVQDELTQCTKDLEQKKADEARLYPTGRGYWFNGRWIYNTRKGTGDSSAAIQALQIKVMTSTQEVKKQTELVNRCRQQVSLCDQQIAPIQARVAQVDAALKIAQPGTRQ